MGGTDAYRISRNEGNGRWELWNTIGVTPILMTSWPAVWKQHIALAMSLHYIFAFVFESTRERVDD